MAHQFKFGDKVWHEKYGLGVVIGTDKLVRVFFEDGIVVGFYTARVVNEDRLVSELSPVSDWIEIDYSNNRTLPSESMSVLLRFEDGCCVSGHYNRQIDDFEYFIEEYPSWMLTHWQPLPQPTE